MNEEPTAAAQYIVNAQGAIHSVNSPYTFRAGERSATAAEIAAYKSVYENPEMAGVSYPYTGPEIPISVAGEPATPWTPGKF